jgi:hypothetical protein
VVWSESAGRRVEPTTEELEGLWRWEEGMSEDGNCAVDGDCKRDDASDAVPGDTTPTPSGVLMCLSPTADAASLSVVGDGGTGSLDTDALMRL